MAGPGLEPGGSRSMGAGSVAPRKLEECRGLYPSQPNALGMSCRGLRCIGR